MRTVVGVFDSGVGGLTVADELRRLSPALPLRYLADSAGLPYGERSEQDVSDRACGLAQRLVDEGCALLVIACNTATSAALERLRDEDVVKPDDSVVLLLTGSGSNAPPPAVEVAEPRALADVMGELDRG